MVKQTKTGKAFEYSILVEFYNRLNKLTRVSIVKNEPFNTAKKYFESFDADEKDAYVLNASAAVNFLMDIEPRLSHGISEKDELQLEIANDKKGQSGDVRDVIFIRSIQKWEIGISAKNNHRALKHSRLSGQLNFGKKWAGIKCSDSYFEEISPIFDKLSSINRQNKNTTWDEVFQDKNKEVYTPILEAFKKEILLIQEKDKKNFAASLVSYLVGNNDFYKLIKSKYKLEIQAFNMKGTLNQPFKNIKPRATIPKLKLPSRLIELTFKPNNHNTLIAYFDEGWQISFRIHSAKSTIESSLKFDINLISTPHTLFTNHLFIGTK